MKTIKNKDSLFLKKYFSLYQDQIENLLQYEDKIINFKKLILKIKKKKGKILIFGNGGSDAIASHVAVDFTKVAKVNTLNINNSSLLTCYANDYGYSFANLNILKNYLNEKKDLIIIISSSGKSKNMKNIVKYCNRKKIIVVSLTGFNEKNFLNKYSNLYFWVDSKAYNVIENIHQILLLTMCDLIKGKAIYPAK